MRVLKIMSKLMFKWINIVLKIYLYIWRVVRSNSWCLAYVWLLLVEYALFFSYQIAVTSVCPAILEVSATRPALNVGLWNYV
jgi:hypothetical protein